MRLSARNTAIKDRDLRFVCLVERAVLPVKTKPLGVCHYVDGAIFRHTHVTQAVGRHEYLVAWSGLEMDKLVSVEAVQTVPCREPQHAVLILQHL